MMSLDSSGGCFGRGAVSLEEEGEYKRPDWRLSEMNDGRRTARGMMPIMDA